ncbi:SRPBCC domain-containing protein [Novosphingobium sp. KCTC 2891]|uniref:SRPBCC domain-containing protein n=1 Tax=Novosphingobium sp. KCTC 2891 TaxID=2989730 RepID=UPI002223CF23|nr:SRPBCC domain-containing protein [Novosphingobium sp. KCTC 2891]MCW1381349.1 SRPBCC domain-containing protein [Novosphingobium sp. KCTC 2891]
MRIWCGIGAGAALLASTSPASADVVVKEPNGFVVRVAAEVTATPAEAWRTLVAPAQWWTSQHTFSGDAANLTLEPVPGGCFCEKLPVPKDAPKGQRPGGVQHMRVLYVEPGRAIRLSGALGPLQSEALNATMTMTVKPTETGSRVLFEYVVGGFMRYKIDEIAPAVDRMLSGQMSALARQLGPVASAPAAEPVAPLPEAAPTAEPDATPSAAVAPQGWSLPPGPKQGQKPGLGARAATTVPPAKASPAKAAVMKAPAATTPVAKASPVKASAAKAAATRPAPVRAAATKSAKPVDKEHEDANAAFDALLGGSGTPTNP